jgi:putative copper export protein/methionine-rich copper-binding protein CopC
MIVTRHLAKGSAAAILAAALSLLGPTVAFAHPRFERSEPAAGAHLDRVPAGLRLVFSAAIERAFTRLQLLGPDSTEVQLGEIGLDSARIVTTAIRGALRAGTYTVVWQVAGADGHPIRGRYSFTIAPGAAGVADAPSGDPPRGEPAGAITAPGQSPAPGAHHPPTTFPEGEGFDAESPLYVAIRWVGFTALLIVVGAVAFKSVVLELLSRRNPDGSHRTLGQRAGPRAAALGLAAAIALGIAALARLLAQSYAMHGADGALDGSLMSTMLMNTIWGWGWILQGFGVMIAVAGFALARRGSSAGWATAALGAFLLAFTPALSGHAAAVPRVTGLAIVLDGLHVIGAAGWLGSLLFVVAVGVPAALRLEQTERGSSVAALVNAFSPTALLFAGITAATGLVAAWIHLGSLSALWETSYGRTLLIKLAVLSIVVATGAYNWRRVRPALGDVAGAVRVRRSATAELAVGALVLAVTAVLVATPTGVETHETTAAAADRAEAAKE